VMQVGGTGVHRVVVLDSHTGGEPTRLVLSGGPDLGSGSLREQRGLFQSLHDDFRAGVILEPRGSDVLVGAVLGRPESRESTTGVVFFNNVGVLGMCGHGTIGVMVSLVHAGRIGPGRHQIETPVGTIQTEVHDGARVTVQNVPSYRFATNVEVRLSDDHAIRGDVAWGGNWFFLARVDEVPLEMKSVPRLLEIAGEIREALRRQGVTGEDGAEIDHIELWAPSLDGVADCRNFVLCPGGAYDRSPCGTGTSAKVACLAADGALKPGTRWKQQGITGSLFEASYAVVGGKTLPSVTGEAFVTAETTLVFQENDPFRQGIRT
jgi:4-hydroxyproline epimerase